MYEKQVIPKTVPKVPQMSVFEVSVAALHITGLLCSFRPWWPWWLRAAEQIDFPAVEGLVSNPYSGCTSVTKEDTVSPQAPRDLQPDLLSSKDEVPAG